MPEYEHTQPGTLMRIVFGSGTLIAGSAAVWVALSSPKTALAPIAVTLALLVCLLLFHALSVSVSSECIRLRFGIGIIQKRFAMTDIQKATIVRNHWYYGWGIKYSPHGWLFNVSGFDALEIQLSTGRTFRIGTDEPAELSAAIERAIARQG